MAETELMISYHQIDALYHKNNFRAVIHELYFIHQEGTDVLLGCGL